MEEHESRTRTRSQRFSLLPSCIQKAATCLVAYWEAKVRVWGEDHAFHRLILDDFTEEDQCALGLGGIRCLPGRDKAGRAIVRQDSLRPATDSRIDRVWYVNGIVEHQQASFPSRVSPALLCLYESILLTLLDSLSTSASLSNHL
jgi:hypothetical protein